jgi:hypothetical protein
MIRAMRQAREAIERTAYINPNLEASLPPIEDRLERWKREANERAREKRENDYRAIERRITSDVLATVRTMIDAAISGARQDHIENFLPEFARQFRDQIDDYVCAEIERAYKLATAELRADLENLRQAIQKAYGADGTIINLPPLRSGKPLN